MASEVNYDRIGTAVIDAIILGGMVKPDVDGDGVYTGVLKWSGNAPEQIGEAVRREVARQTREGNVAR